MKPSLRHSWFLLSSLAGLLSSAALLHGASPQAALRQGEFGGDLPLLKSSYRAPLPGESNHYFELWKPGVGIRDIARVQGLTNNHALVVHSHGRAMPASGKPRYAFVPHEARVAGDAAGYSVRDLFTVLGPAAAAQIHNICVSGCNVEGAFNAGDLRTYFPNATNITHMAAGQSGFESMFIQALTLHSGNVRPLFETRQRNAAGQPAYSLDYTFTSDARRLPPYEAELFVRSAKRPFKVQVAGRELLDAGFARR